MSAVLVAAAGCSARSSATATTARLAGPVHRTAPTATGPSTSAPSAAPTLPATPVTRAVGWSPVLTTLPPGGGFTSLSCISDTFCVAAGGGANQADSLGTAGSGVTVSWDGATWSNPSVDDPAPASGPVTTPIMPAIACTGGPLCVIVDGTDHQSTGNGTDWSAPSPLPLGAPLPASPGDPGPGHPGSRTAAVVCPSPELCAVVDNTGHAIVDREGSWQAASSFGTPAPPQPSVALYQQGPIGLSCPSASSCTAVVGNAVLDWDGSAWMKEAAPWTAGPVAPTGAAVACLATGLCGIVSGTSLTVRTGAQPWSSPEVIDAAGGLDSISCPTSTFCMAADQRGGVLQWNGGSWSAPVQLLPQASEYTGDPTTVACSSPQFCMVMNGDGDYATFTGSVPPVAGGVP